MSIPEDHRGGQTLLIVVLHEVAHLSLTSSRSIPYPGELRGGRDPSLTDLHKSIVDPDLVIQRIEACL